MLTKKDLEHLAALARIDLGGNEAKVQKDLGNILDHFQELQSVNTDNIEPMTGGTELKNVLREDAVWKMDSTSSPQADDTGKGAESFPDKKDGYLKVPPVF